MTTLTISKSKISTCLRYFFIAVTGGFLAFTVSSLPALAEPDLSSIEDFQDAIATLVETMTAVAVAPAGLSAAIKCFRHIVLANV